uniref:NADH dehydrogenase subunit 6 n=1 Tax=Trichonephila clavata TaxID=2740835 RepID=Q1JQQ9_TRICU|nr:NADH dehydrogenase subunit 6 [Trichonephila clavata]AAS15716.1 NADH dehydrogenase subunit 6 [Trichonephila clavata]
MVLFLGLMFILSIQPMMVISSLMLVVMIYSLMISFEVGSYWFSYMLVLVMLSGVLVVFTYMMSIFPNESFEISSLLIVMVMFFIFYSFKEESKFFMNWSSMSVKIWEGVSMLSSLYLVMFLLAVMIVVIWLSGMKEGAVRI